jgi:hypothetical protein
MIRTDDLIFFLLSRGIFFAVEGFVKRRRGRVADSGGLENRRAFTGPGGSNPSASVFS